MSETNIGRNLPKAHSVKPAVDGKERAKREETPAKPESKQQQKNLNLNEDPAVTVGKSQVKPTGKKPYAYRPGNTATDLENLKIMDEALGVLAEQIAKKHRVSVEDAKLFLYEQIAQELSAA